MSVPKRLLVVGDRVLVIPDEGEERTRAGLILPAGAVAQEPVQSGRIVATGPGTPIPDANPIEEEPWKVASTKPRFLPMQAREGDYAIFFRKAAVEIQYDGRDYLIVPQSALLVLIRDTEED